MIEIILRDDITDYESKAFFGFSRRTILFAALLVALTAGTAILLTNLNTPLPLIGYFLIAEGIVVGVIGMGRFSGQTLEKHLAIIFKEFFIPKHLSIETPVVASATDKRLEEVRSALTKKDKQSNRRESE